MKGIIPSIIFGTFILLIILMVSLAIFHRDGLQEFIKDGLTDHEPISANEN
ncbi:hypothetical protein ACOJQI_11300 [Bacillus salacetis]|uniref:hypothetical protein n=1 Tax=Bacillus salacetis TaxID=2315464 RepID=UPI003BA0ED7D